MLLVVLLIAAVVGAWGVVAVGFALLAGGVIHARDHLDVPALSRPAPVAAMTEARRSR